jgi:hypothetical protein
MALYNSEAISGFPTGNLSLALLDKINPEKIHFVREFIFRTNLFNLNFFKDII